jgi:hypothetical protein
MPLVLWLVPARQLGGLIKKLRFILLCMVFSVEYSLIWGLCAVIEYFPTLASRDVGHFDYKKSAFAKIVYVVLHPLDFLGAMGVHLDSGLEIVTRFNKVLTWDAIPTGTVFIVLLPLLFASAYEPVSTPPIRFLWRERLAVLGIFLAGFIMVYLVRFLIVPEDLQWHRLYGFLVIGRYLLPLLPLLALMCYRLVPLPGAAGRVYYALSLVFLLGCLVYLHSIQLHRGLRVY